MPGSPNRYHANVAFFLANMPGFASFTTCPCESLYRMMDVGTKSGWHML
jgi:hypothetical protein